MQYDVSFQEAPWNNRYTVLPPLTGDKKGKQKCDCSYDDKEIDADKQLLDAE